MGTYVIQADMIGGTASTRACLQECQQQRPHRGMNADVNKRMSKIHYGGNDNVLRYHHHRMNLVLPFDYCMTTRTAVANE